MKHEPCKSYGSSQVVYAHVGESSVCLPEDPLCESKRLSFVSSWVFQAVLAEALAFPRSMGSDQA